MKWIKAAVLGTSMLVAVSACKHEGSDIQKHYAADRADCREYAEATVGAPQGGDFFPQAAGGQIDLVRAFARCMHQRGWAVNKPPEDKDGKEKESGGGDDE